MIPVAAFAVTATGVSAFNSDILEKIDIDLTTSQIEALEEAHELRTAGDYEEARATLEDADIDREILHEIRSATHEYRQEVREEIKEAVENNDYDAFVLAATDTKLIEAIEDEDDFELFVEAKELAESGDREGAKEIFEELGIEKPGHGKKHGGDKGFRGGDRSNTN